MTDAHRRALERGGDHESEARALLEAVRAGEVTQADLDLAADLGDARAALATGRPRAPLDAVCAELAAGERLIAAACALGELVFPAWCWPRAIEPMVGEWVGEGVEALRAARDHGTPVEPERAWNAHDASTERDHHLNEPGALAALIVARCCEAVCNRPPSLAHAARLAAGLLGEAEVRAALGRALLGPRLRPPAAVGPPAGWCSEIDHLRRRLETGQCTRVQLELVHHLGHEAASEALGLAPATTPPAGAEWIAALDPDAALTRAVAVRTLLGCVSRSVPPDPATSGGAALRAVAAWCVAPDGVGAAAERQALADAALRASHVEPLVVSESQEQVVRAIFDTSPVPVELLPLAARACGATPREARDLLAAGTRIAERHDLSDTARREVIPWLLGHRDLLLELDER